MERNCDSCRYYGKCHTENTFLQLDSYIEECFYQKCSTNNTCGILLLEWIDSKNVYVRYSRLSRSDYGNYSKHDESHSIAILNAISSVLGKTKIDLLSAMDLWFLLHCAYGHDIGMPFSYDQMKEFWKNIREDSEFGEFFMECLVSEDADLCRAAQYINAISSKIKVDLVHGTKSNDQEQEKLGTEWVALVYRYTSYLTAEFVRKNHAKRSEEILASCEILQRQGHSQIEARFYKIIAKCCGYHGSNRDKILEELEKHEWDIEGENCHPRFVAYMLRLGDLLDIGNNRFDWIDAIHYGNMQEKSKLHKKKHDAIEHIKYTDKVIEIIARSDDENVCQVANDWFNSLKDEVRFLVMHWNEFAPDVLGGCTLSEPKTQVYLKNKIFYRIEDCEFKVDKNTLIDLVIGRNLYKTQFDFMKEYIQNALDAVKMKFWIDIKDGNLDYFIISDIKTKPAHRAEILPFDFKQIIFQQYAIDVVCEYREKKNPETQVNDDVIHIEIIDKGIGIDRECIDAISNIGSGWRRRKRYMAYLNSMPKWLKPTGGFGIGMQSGFMITNEIQIETRCDDDRQGRKIGLYSNKKNGRIEEKEYSVRANGTKISVDVPYRWFMDRENYKEYPELAIDAQMIDFMDPKQTIEIITSFIEKYLQTILGNPLFPVNVKQKGRKSKQIQGFWFGKNQKCSEFVWKGMSYSIFKTENCDKLLIWDNQCGIACQISLDDSSENIPVENWYFKGVKVWTNDQAEDKHRGLYRYIGNFNIDIMGLEVKDCLTIDRNRFKIGFAYRKLSDLYAVICLNFLIDNELLFCEPLTGRKFLRGLLAYKYSTEKGKQVIRNCLDDISSGQSLLSRDDAIVLHFGAASEEKAEPTMEIGTIYGMCFELYFSNSLRWGSIKHPIKNKVLEEEIRNSYTDVWDITDDDNNKLMPLIRSLLEENYSGTAAIWENEYVEIYKYDQSIYNEDSTAEVKRDVFLPQNGCRQIFYTKDNFFPELHVAKIPFMEDLKRDVSHKNAIISPIPAIFSDRDIVVSASVKEDPDEFYFNQIAGNELFVRLVDWVYTYQKIPQRYSRDQIKSAYEELVRYIYQQYISTQIIELLK